MKLLKLVFLLIFVCSAKGAEGTVSYTYDDQFVYSKCIQDLQKYSHIPANELLVKIASYFKNTPYVASTLDKNEQEQLVVNLHEFDCTTFVETCVALTLTLKSTDKSFANFCQQLQQIRYREGNIEDYASRLHYVTDWVADNSLIFRDITKSLGGILETKKIDFMSSHISAYKPLAANEKLQIKVKNIEDSLNSQGGFYILPKNQIRQVADSIQDGDIIAFGTSIPGLDYSHIAIAYHINGELSFIHASTRKMKVVTEDQSLVEYCLKSPKCTGISVFSLRESIK